MWSSFQNLESVADIAGAEAAARLRQIARSELERLGETLVIGDELATVASCAPGDVIDELRPISWLAHIFIGMTEVWELRVPSAVDATAQQVRHVPTRLLELSAGLRFGIISLADGSAAAFDAARAQAEEQKLAKRGVTRFGFAPLWPTPYHTLTQLADPSCPGCSASRPHVVKEAAGHTVERCTDCDLVFERHPRLFIGGRDVSECARPHE